MADDVAITAGSGNWLGLQRWMTNEALVIRVHFTGIPDSTRLVDGSVLGIPVDVPRTDSLVNVVYRYAGLFQRASLALESSHRTIAMNLSIPFLALGQGLEVRGERARAVEALRKAYHLAPNADLVAVNNLVMVGHNSVIGEDCLIAGQSGISGSCLVGDRVTMGGQVGIADHMRIGNDVVIAASSGVSQHIPARSIYIDTPAIPYARWQERYRGIGRLKRLLQEVRRLGERLRLLERVTGIGGDNDPLPPARCNQDPGEP